MPMGRGWGEQRVRIRDNAVRSGEVPAEILGEWRLPVGSEPIA